MRLLTLLILSSSSAMVTIAQSYLPLFGDTSRMWTSQVSGSSNGLCLETWRTTYWIDGNAVIDGDNYIQVRSRVRYYITPIVENCNEMTEYPGQTRFVREAGHQVYARTSFSSAEVLIYDMDVQVGDSVPYPSNAPWGDDQAIVTGIDSTMIGGVYRSRYAVSAGSLDTDTVWIIEGIGATTGPFSELQALVGVESSLLLNCVRENSIVVFGDPYCEIITNVPSTTLSAAKSPYPNPSPGELILDDRVQRVTAIAADGRLLFEGQCMDHRVQINSTGPMTVVGFDRSGVKVGQWLVVLLRH